jgi:hypothetical protein
MGGMTVALKFLNPNYSAAQEKVKKAQNALEQATSALDSTEERFQLWIEAPDRERCNNEEGDVCINNAQLGAIRQRM